MASRAAKLDRPGLARYNRRRKCGRGGGSALQETITHSREETVALGEKMARELGPSALVCLLGDLGAGKTALCEGFARGLGCTDPVSSPTFALVNLYRGPHPFAHFDLWRIGSYEDLCAAGFYDYLDSGIFVATEWSENCLELLREEGPLWVRIRQNEDGSRTITAETEKHEDLGD